MYFLWVNNIDDCFRDICKLMEFFYRTKFKMTMEESRGCSNFRSETYFYEFPDLEMQRYSFELSQENTLIPKAE